MKPPSLRFSFLNAEPDKSQIPDPTHELFLTRPKVKSMRFPMYTIHSDLLQQMTKIEPHEVLKAICAARSLRSEFRESGF